MSPLLMFRSSLFGRASLLKFSVVLFWASLFGLSFGLGGIANTELHAEERLSIELTDRARKLHADLLLIDGHNDLPWEIRMKGASSFKKLDISKRQEGILHTDIPRLREGNVGAQFWSVWVPTSRAVRGTAFMTTLEQIELVKKMIQHYPADLQLALSTEDIKRCQQEGKIASLIGVEGGHCIENSLHTLHRLYALGARYMTLTHSDSLNWADSATDDEKNGGLTDFGREVVQEMNQLGMMVDLSHVSTATMHQALDASSAPVIFSHSAARAIADHPRNVPDDVLKRLPSEGGIVMVNFYSGFIHPDAADLALKKFAITRELQLKYEEDEMITRGRQKWSRENPMPRGTIHDVLDHIDHIVKIAGIDHVGIGADFDGVGSLPVQLEGVQMYPYITQGLLDRGYSDEAIRKIAGGNLMRVFREVERLVKADEQ